MLKLVEATALLPALAQPAVAEWLVELAREHALTVRWTGSSASVTGQVDDYEIEATVHVLARPNGAGTLIELAGEARLPWVIESVLKQRLQTSLRAALRRAEMRARAEGRA